MPPPGPTGPWPAPGFSAHDVPQYPQGPYQAPGQGYFAPAPPYVAPGHSPTNPYQGAIARPATLKWAAGLMGLGALFGLISMFNATSALTSNATAKRGVP